jgi:putative IMPACT (imprinted ancient) family translation regulator
LRAYTDSVAQALLHAEKVPVIRHTTLRCVLPYALEGWLRRELDTHGARLLDAVHGEGVAVTLQLPEANAATLAARINDAGQGKVVWLDEACGG